MTEKDNLKFKSFTRDLLEIAVFRSDKLSSVLPNNFSYIGDYIIDILDEEYKKPKSSYRIITGALCVLTETANQSIRVKKDILRNSYPLLSKALKDKRVFVKRQAVLAVLNLIGALYVDFVIHSNKIGDKEELKKIKEEIKIIKKYLLSREFLDLFNSLYPSKLERDTHCKIAGIKLEELENTANKILG